VDVQAFRADAVAEGVERALGAMRDVSCAPDDAVAGDLFCPAAEIAREAEDHVILRVADPSAAPEALRRVTTELARRQGSEPAPLYQVTAGEDGEIRVAIAEGALDAYRQAVAAQSVEVIRRRAGAFGVDVRVAEEDGRVAVRVAPIEDSERLKDIIGRPAQLTIQLVASDDPVEISEMQAGGAPVPPGRQILPTQTGGSLLLWRGLAPEDTARGEDGRLVRILSGRHVRRAAAGFHPQTSAPVVNIQLDATGAEIFAKLTANHIGERIAIVLNGEIVTAPAVRTEIPGGALFIEGGFTVEEARRLATELNAAALPAPLILIEERTEALLYDGTPERLAPRVGGGAAGGRTT
jgi:protein-export membrane protein SecD